MKYIFEGDESWAKETMPHIATLLTHFVGITEIGEKKGKTVPFMQRKVKLYKQKDSYVFAQIIKEKD